MNSTSKAASDLTKAIEYAAEFLPEGWRVRMEVENGSASVTAIRPDGTEVDMHDDESDLEKMVADAVRLAVDEIEADKMLESD